MTFAKFLTALFLQNTSQRLLLRKRLLGTIYYMYTISFIVTDKSYYAHKLENVGKNGRDVLEKNIKLRPDFKTFIGARR